MITTIAISGIFTSSCNSPAQKVENAENSVNKANIKLDEANKEYLAEVESYRQEVADKIAANDKIIEDFNARIENEKDEVKADYRKKIAELERKNSDTKKRMDDYKIEGKEKWADFKAKFSQDMDELGRAFSNFFS